LAAVLFYLQSLLHGAFASGFIPILRSYVKAHAPLAFALYFAGLVLGQLAIVASARLRRPRLAYPAYEAAFGATLIAMALGFGWLPFSLLAGRFFEGLTAGLAVPLLFHWVAGLSALGSAARRIALFNSLFAVGFVVGPPLVAGLLRLAAPPLLLGGFGALFVVCALALMPLLGAVPDDSAETGPRAGWLDTFYPLALGKCAYGFILPFTTQVLADRLPLSVAVILLALSGVFIVGQWLGGVATARFSPALLADVLPLLLGGFVVAMAVPALAWLLFAGGLVHSLLMFVALMNLARTPGNARQFALLSSLSDPGLVLGAGLAGLGAAGLAGLALLCLVPLARRLW
jgi:MFS family permease